MSNEATKEAEETETKPTITVAEKTTGTSTSKETITVAEKSDKPE